MCGIIGYIGKNEALPILIGGLKRLEYRGYDSAGVVVLGKEAYLNKSPGKISKLEKIISQKDIKGSVGIAHTRWATHGKPTAKNSHPHTDCEKKFFIVHNGIIENYMELKKQLEKLGHKFYSQTDSEVFAHLLEEEHKELNDFEKAFKVAVSKIKGAYAIVALSFYEPDKMLVAKKSSPIVIGLGKNEYIVASDASALLGKTKDVIYLSDDEIAICKKDSIKINTLKKENIKKKVHKIDFDAEDSGKGHFETYMQKEIFEAPEVIKNAIRGRLLENEWTAKFGGLDNISDKIKNIESIMIVACGTSYYAGLLGKYWLEDISGISTQVEIASEFKSKNILLNNKTLMIVISQSGETADTLEALKEAKRKGVASIGIVNTVGSSIAREADAGIYNHAGPEISVASTKAFISQAIILAMLILFFGRKRNINMAVGKKITSEIKNIHTKIEETLELDLKVRKIAKKYSKYKNFIFLGRKYNFPVALEGALKLKEISYIHAEGYAGGELKHGPLALINKSFPVFCIAPKDSVYDKMISNILEVKARGGKVICVATKGDKKIKKISDDVIYIPKSSEMLYPILSAIIVQLFSYNVAHILKRDIDKPRNLAKSVTVE